GPPENEQDNGDRDEPVADGVFLDGCELLVRHRYRPGQPYARLEARPDRGGGLADRLGRHMAGFDRAIVEDRAKLDEPAEPARRRRVALDQPPPGKARRLA